jgi:2'-phosphotransferase
MSKKNDTAISKQLSYLLRHDPSLQRDSAGYVHDSVVFERIPGLTFPVLKRIVDQSAKSRFDLLQRDGRHYVRANQGHSASIAGQLDDSAILTPLVEPLDGCFHGTYSRFLPLIQQGGLKTMSRAHIHIAKHHHARSGQRPDCDVFIYIDIAAAMADGIPFFESKNGVILTPGIDGVLPPKYFKSISKQ